MRLLVLGSVLLATTLTLGCDGPAAPATSPPPAPSPPAAVPPSQPAASPATAATVAATAATSAKTAENTATLPPGASPVDIAAALPQSGTVPLADGGRVIVENDDHVRIEDAKGANKGESSCGMNGFSYRKTVELMLSLQQAMRANEHEKVAGLMRYPLKLNRDKGPRMIPDRASFLRDYALVFPPAAAKKILDAEGRAIFCRAEGFMLGDGVVWGFGGDKKPYGIFVVNN